MKTWTSHRVDGCEFTGRRRGERVRGWLAPRSTLLKKEEQEAKEETEGGVITPAPAETKIQTPQDGGGWKQNK